MKNCVFCCNEFDLEALIAGIHFYLNGLCEGGIERFKDFRPFMIE
jgi:hypothetical protein